MERTPQHIVSFVIGELEGLKELALFVYPKEQLPGIFASPKAQEDAEEALYDELTRWDDFVSKSSAVKNSIRCTKTHVQLFLSGNPSNEDLSKLSERFSLSYLLSSIENYQSRERGLCTRLAQRAFPNHTAKHLKP